MADVKSNDWSCDFRSQGPFSSSERRQRSSFVPRTNSESSFGSTFAKKSGIETVNIPKISTVVLFLFLGRCIQKGKNVKFHLNFLQRVFTRKYVSYGWLLSLFNPSLRFFLTGQDENESFFFIFIRDNTKHSQRNNFTCDRIISRTKPTRYLY